MAVFPQLYELYTACGFEIRSSLNPYHFGNSGTMELPFTYFLKEGQLVCKGGGIGASEIYFLEALFEDYKPTNIFVIGNAFGWSTTALSLICPDARVVAIDSCEEGGGATLGLQVTKLISEREGLDVVAVRASSPADVSAVCDEHFSSPIDFAFIDGDHTNEQMAADFEAILKQAHEETVYVFHDVINWKLTDAFWQIAEERPELIFKLLFAPPSGIGIAYPPDLKPKIGAAVEAFAGETESLIKTLRSR